MPRRAALVLAIALLPLLAGCLGGEGSGRTGWAYDMVQLDDLLSQGRTGQGVTVAFLDTGIDPHHPSLDHLLDDSRENGQLIAFRDFLGGATGVENAFDEDGHGTHVAGILAARGSSGFDALGGISLLGGAPDVLLVVARVCSGTSCDPAAIPSAISWAVAQGADVVSLSLGGSFGLFDLVQESAIEAAVRRAVDSGTVVVASAGNGGPGQQDPSRRTSDVESPASIPDVIAVGAVGPDGQVAGFSSRGDDAGNPCTGLPLPGLEGRCPPDQKPEIVAPGVGILSAWAGHAGGPCSGAEYCEASGTSQATPFATAAIALMLQARGGDLGGRDDVEAVKQALVETARPLPGQALPHDPGAGYGLLQAEAAVRAFA